MVYFQGSLSSGDYEKNYTPILKTNDLLSIVVTGPDMDAVKPFNLPIVQITNNIGGYTQGMPAPPGYLIDTNGEINFPVIGKIKVVGLTRAAAIDLLKEQLKPFLNNASIQIRILNFKVTVLGEVRSPGTFYIPDERVTLLEAIGIAGDLLITGVRKNILVVRDIEGKKTETRIDLTSKDIFKSPVFYLQQNDVVYIEPNRSKINSAIINTANVSLVISVISLFITMAVLFTRL